MKSPSSFEKEVRRTLSHETNNNIFLKENHHNNNEILISNNNLDFLINQEETPEKEKIFDNHFISIRDYKNLFNLILFTIQQNICRLEFEKELDNSLQETIKFQIQQIIYYLIKKIDCLSDCIKITNKDFIISEGGPYNKIIDKFLDFYLSNEYLYIKNVIIEENINVIEKFYIEISEKGHKQLSKNQIPKSILYEVNNALKKDLNKILLESKKELINDFFKVNIDWKNKKLDLIYNSICFIEKTNHSLNEKKFNELKEFFIEYNNKRCKENENNEYGRFISKVDNILLND